MPTTSPRVNVVLEKPLYASLRRLAAKDGVSMSTKVRDLIREALEEYEDEVLIAVAEARSKTFKRRSALSHAQLWK